MVIAIVRSVSDNAKPGEYTGSSPDPTDYPADLLDAYRLLVRSRERDSANSSYEAYRGIADSSRSIRVHPFWRTLPDPSAVAQAARDLTRLARQPIGRETAEVRAFPPPEVRPSYVYPHLDPAARADLAAALDAAGLWDGLTDEQRAAERRHVEQTGSWLRHEYSYRTKEFFADGEDLSEQGVLRLLDEMAPSLAETGLALDVAHISDPFRPPPPETDDYILGINGIRCQIWSAAEAEAKSHCLWYEATVRPLIVINELLAHVGARERIYTNATGGNEGVAYLIPPQVREVVVEAMRPRYGDESLLPMVREQWGSTG